MNFRAITLQDKELFKKYAVPEGYYGCNLDFTTLFLWNIQEGTTVFEDAAAIYVEAKFFRHIIFFPPLMKTQGADMTGAVEKMYEYSRGKGQRFILRAMSKDMLSRIDKDFLNRFEVIEDRNNFDYIYRADDLITLSGKAFHGKRNHIHQFENSCKFDFRPYTPADCRGVMALYDEWASYQIDIKGVTAEKLAVQSALLNLDALSMRGGIIVIDNAVRAFAFASKSYNDMAIVHFEKADINYKGIYSAINNYFAKNYLNDVSFINRQEDMGKENLRKSKLSYNPILFAEKYILTERGVF